MIKFNDIYKEVVLNYKNNVLNGKQTFMSLQYEKYFPVEILNVLGTHFVIEYDVKKERYYTEIDEDTFIAKLGLESGTTATAEEKSIIDYEIDSLEIESKIVIYGIKITMEIISKDILFMIAPIIDPDLTKLLSPNPDSDDVLYLLQKYKTLEKEYSDLKNKYKKLGKKIEEMRNFRLL